MFAADGLLGLLHFGGPLGFVMDHLKSVVDRRELMARYRIRPRKQVMLLRLEPGDANRRTRSGDSEQV